jgi:hypothetical protein
MNTHRSDLASLLADVSNFVKKNGTLHFKSFSTVSKSSSMLDSGALLCKTFIVFTYSAIKIEPEYSTLQQAIE